MSKHKGHWTHCAWCDKKFVCNDIWPFKSFYGDILCSPKCAYQAETERQELYLEYSSPTWGGAR